MLFQNTTLPERDRRFGRIPNRDRSILQRGTFRGSNANPTWWVINIALDEMYVLKDNGSIILALGVILLLLSGATALIWLFISLFRGSFNHGLRKYTLLAIL